MDLDTKSSDLRKKLKKKTFRVGDWVILSEEALEYLNFGIPEDGRRAKGGTAFCVVGLNPEHRVWDLTLKIGGKIKNVSSNCYRLATEEEKKRTQLKQLFEK